MLYTLPFHTAYQRKQTERLLMALMHSLHSAPSAFCTFTFRPATRLNWNRSRAKAKQIIGSLASVMTNIRLVLDCNERGFIHVHLAGNVRENVSEAMLRRNARGLVAQIGLDQQYRAEMIRSVPGVAIYLARRFGDGALKFPKRSHRLLCSPDIEVVPCLPEELSLNPSWVGNVIRVGAFMGAYRYAAAQSLLERFQPCWKTHIRTYQRGIAPKRKAGAHPLEVWYGWRDVAQLEFFGRFMPPREIQAPEEDMLYFASLALAFVSDLQSELRQYYPTGTFSTSDGHGGQDVWCAYKLGSVWFKVGLDVREAIPCSELAELELSRLFDDESWHGASWITPPPDGTFEAGTN